MLLCGCVWCVHVCTHTLGACLHVCVFVQADSLVVCAWCVCVCVCVTVSGLCTCVWASVCLYLSAFVMLLKAVLPLMLNRVFQAPG